MLVIFVLYFTCTVAPPREGPDTRVVDRPDGFEGLEGGESPLLMMPLPASCPPCLHFLAAVNRLVSCCMKRPEPVPLAAHSRYTSECSFLESEPLRTRCPLYCRVPDWL